MKKKEELQKREFKWESVTAVATLVLSIATLFTICVMHTQVKDARDMDRVKNLIDLHKEFDSREFATIRRDLAAKRLDADGHLRDYQGEAPSEAYEIMNFFDHVGMLLNRQHLDSEDVWEEMSYWISGYHEDFKDVIYEERKSDPAAYLDFDKLAQAMDEISKHHYKNAAYISETNLEEFYRYELQNPLSPPLSRKNKSSKK